MDKTDINKKIKSLLQSAVENYYGANYNESIRELKAAEVFDKNNPEILYNLGLCYLKMGLYKTAILYLERILYLPMKYIELKKVRKLIALGYIKRKDFNNAVKQLDEIINSSPADTSALNMKAYCYHKQKNYFESLKYYKIIIDIDEKNFNACNSIAFILAETEGDLSEALKYGKKAIKYSSSNPAYLDTIGYIYLKMKDYSNAEKFFKRAKILSPHSAEIEAHIRELQLLKSK